MKIVILLLSLLGLTFSLPVSQMGRPLATSNSREILQLMQRYMGNVPQQTQQRARSGPGLPPAKLVPDQNPSANQGPNEQVAPLEWTFANFPVISNSPQIPSELGGPNMQNLPAFNVLPLTQMFPMDINSLAVLLGALSTTQTLPVAGGGMTVPQQLLPSQPMLPIIFAQMGPQGAVLSSEEMQPLSQIVGVLVPGMQGGLFPSGQAGAHLEGLPAGQAGSNQGNLPFPEDTAAGIQKVFQTTNYGLNEAASGSYPTPSGFRQPDAETNGVFVEPTAGVNMEPSELREPPTSLVRLDKDNDQKQQHGLSRSLMRGDSYVPINAVERKPLKAP
ncbi:amelotin [Rhineura floridana]|uniref:amelotin n=1 Tax=Rhineura floridana TaxID=261503 RepID=UPI002AC86A75|nr:amelotin [Rhineura floridana]